MEHLKIPQEYISITDNIIQAAFVAAVVRSFVDDRHNEYVQIIGRNGKEWLIRSDDEWSDIGIDAIQARKARMYLSDKGLIDARKFMFDGRMRIHIAIIDQRLIELWQ